MLGAEHRGDAVNWNYIVVALAVLLARGWAADTAPMLTLSGEMPLRGMLGRRGTELPTDLTLVHTFVNIGSRFISKVGIAELESQVIPLTAGHFLWVTPYGRVRKGRLGTLLLDGKRTWTVKAVGSDCEIRSGTNCFKYRRGLLVESVTGGVVVSFENGNGGVEKVVGGGEKLEVFRRQDGYVLVAGNFRAEIATDAWGRIVSCQGGTPGNANRFSFEYQRDFLSRFDANDNSFHITVGDCEWTGDFTRGRVFHPIVEEIGDTKVHIKRDLNEIIGTLTRHGAQLTYWRAQRKAGEFQVCQASGTGGQLLADVDAYIFDVN